MTKDELYRLLEEMTPSGGLTDSAEDPSWFAHRKAEKLEDGQLFALLRELIGEHRKKEDRELRRNAYFVMTRLLRRKMDPEYCQFLVDCLATEENRYVIDAMLTGIGWLKIPEAVRIQPIIDCSRSDKRLIRHSAIYALRAADTEDSREAVRYWVRQEDEKKFKYELIYAQAALGQIGEEADIGLLERHTASRIRDVRDSAKYAAEAIRNRKCNRGGA